MERIPFFMLLVSSLAVSWTVLLLTSHLKFFDILLMADVVLVVSRQLLLVSNAFRSSFGLDFVKAFKVVNFALSLLL